MCPYCEKDLSLNEIEEGYCEDCSMDVSSVREGDDPKPLDFNRENDPWAVEPEKVWPEEAYEDLLFPNEEYEEGC